MMGVAGFQKILTIHVHQLIFLKSERDYYLKDVTQVLEILVPRDVASRAAKAECDAGHGVGKTKTCRVS